MHILDLVDGNNKLKPSVTPLFTKSRQHDNVILGGYENMHSMNILVLANCENMHIVRICTGLRVAFLWVCVSPPVRYSMFFSLAKVRIGDMLVIHHFLLNFCTFVVTSCLFKMSEALYLLAKWR